MANVFVSYSRKNVEFTKRLIGELQKNDLDFWVDWEGIPPTVDWMKEIEKGIQEADTFVAIVTHEWIASQPCRDELTIALQNGKRLIPVVPSDLNWNDVPQQLSHLNYVFFRETDDFEAALKKLLTGIHTDYEWVQQQRWLQVRALDWQRDNKDSGSLLRGQDLLDAERQLATNSSKEPYPTDLQREYVFESRKVTDKQRRITTGVSIAGVIALAALALWGWGQAGLATRNAIASDSHAATAQANLVIAQTAQTDAKNKKILADSAAATAVANANEAKRQSQIAFARQLAAEANAILASPTGNSETAALLSLRALQLQDVYIPAADEALVASLDRLYTTKIYSQHDARVSTVAYSPKGDQIAIGYVDGTAGLYAIKTGQTVRNFDGFAGYIDGDGDPFLEGVHAVAFSSTGDSLLVAGSDGHIQVWDLTTDTNVSDFYIAQENLPLWSAKFSPDGEFILVGSGNPPSGAGSIYLLKTKTGETKFTFPHLQERYITDVEFSRDGSSILSSSFDGTAILWKMNWATFSANPLHTFKLSAPIRDGAISSDGNSVLLGSDNNTAELDSVEGTRLQHFIGHTSPIYSVNFSPIPGYILTGSWDNTARLWDMESGKVVRTFANHTDHILSTAFSPDGKQILTGSYDHTARLWAADPIHDTRTIYGHSNRVNSVSFSPDGKSILSASNDNTVRLWNAQTLEPQDLPGSASLLGPQAVFSALGHWIAAAGGVKTESGGNDLKIILWEKVGSEYKQSTVLDPVEFVTSLVFSGSISGHDSDYLFVGRADPFCNSNLWKNTDGAWQVVGEYFAYCWNGDVAMTPDARYAAIAVAYDIPIYRIDDGTQFADCVATLPSGDASGSNVLAFSSDGKYLATHVENQVWIWDWQAEGGCAPVQKLAGHSAALTDLAFSPDGNYLLSASLDGTAILWDAKTWKIVRTLTGHEGEVTSVGFSPDSKFIVTGGGDKTIRIWDVNYKDTVQQVCSLLARDLTEAERTKYGITDTNPTCGD